MRGYRKIVERLAVLTLVLMPLTGSAQGGAMSVTGLWRTIDDETGKPKAAVRLVEKDGALFGHVEALLDPEAKKDGRCDKCTDERKDQPIVGLTIVRNLKRDPDTPGRWSGGDILDPNNGKVYRSYVQLVEDGRKLEVRGFIGFALLGRTQVWERAE